MPSLDAMMDNIKCEQGSQLTVPVDGTVGVTPPDGPTAVGVKPFLTSLSLFFFSLLTPLSISLYLHVASLLSSSVRMFLTPLHRKHKHV